MTETLRERKDMDPQFMWDLTKMYADDAAWENAFGQIDPLIASVAEMAGSLHSAENILEYFKRSTQLGRTLGNLFECDLAGVIHVFEKNEKEGNILNAPVIPSVIGAVDRIVTALFEHTDNIIKGTDFDYDEQSGYIVPKQGPDYMLGDVDKDEKITASDARLALRRAVDLEDYAEGSAEFLACDVDKDSKVTAGDARIILRAAVGLEEIAA